jgi:hypothetical protein
MPPQARRALAEQEFKTRLIELQQCLPPKIQERLKELSFPTIDDSTSFEIQASQMESTIIPLFDMLDKTKNGNSKYRKVHTVVIGWFRASYPVARLLLSVAQSGASVNSPLFS